MLTLHFQVGKDNKYDGHNPETFSAVTPGHLQTVLDDNQGPGLLKGAEAFVRLLESPQDVAPGASWEFEQGQVGQLP